MEIKAVIVENPVSTCRECDFMIREPGGDYDFICLAHTKTATSNYSVIYSIDEPRPDWCPLMAGEFIPTQFDKRYHIIKESEE